MKSAYTLLARFSKQQLQGIIAVLIVAILGVWTLIFTSALTPAGVNFVLLCPPTGYSCSGSTTTLSSYASTIRSWYQGKLGGGHTFVLRSVVLRRTPYAPSYYYVGNTGSYQTTTDRLAAAIGTQNDSSNPIKTVVMMGFHVFNHCGVSAEGGAMAVGDPVYGCSSNEATVLAHELGHSFNLAHNGNYPGDPLHRSDGSLMNAPYACNGSSLSYCALNSTDRSYLLTYQLGWFPVQSTTSTTTTTTTTTSSANPYTAYCPTGSEATVGYGYATSGNCVKKLQWDLDHIQSAGLTIDGSFGSLTYNATKTFQSRHGLTADGICGHNTWSKLDTYYK